MSQQQQHVQRVLPRDGPLTLMCKGLISLVPWPDKQTMTSILLLWIVLAGIGASMAYQRSEDHCEQSHTYPRAMGHTVLHEPSKMQCMLIYAVGGAVGAPLYVPYVYFTQFQHSILKQ
jgi:hypothetical protein